MLKRNDITSSMVRALDQMERGAKDADALLTDRERETVLRIVAKADARYAKAMGTY